jgi:hypothetical protein
MLALRLPMRGPEKTIHRSLRPQSCWQQELGVRPVWRTACLQDSTKSDPAVSGRSRASPSRAPPTTIRSMRLTSRWRAMGTVEEEFFYEGHGQHL